MKRKLEGNFQDGTSIKLPEEWQEMLQIHMLSAYRFSTMYFTTNRCIWQRV